MDRALLMIPGPIEFEPEVLTALAQKTDSHLAPAFIARFSRTLKALREVFHAPDGQPFVVAGSGTLAMEMAAVNVLEAGDRVLVLNTGYFSERYVRLLERYGAAVTVLHAPVGGTVAADEVARSLAQADYKAVVATHVDTSTGVRVDAEAIARVAQAHGVLSIFDGVCATAGERFEQSTWGADIYFTGSQKALGVPPGLAIVMAGPRAIEIWRKRTTPVANFYCDWGEWLPVMEAYEAERVAYFATPAVNLVNALDASLHLILQEGIETVWARHERIATAARAAWQALGMELVPQDVSLAANTLSAVRYPAGVDVRLVAQVAKEGVIIAGGLHPEIRGEYFRVGHMGAVKLNDVLAAVGAIERALVALSASVEIGSGVLAAQAAAQLPVMVN